MSRYNGEEILVIPRALFDSLGAFDGLKTDVDSYISEIINPENNFFMDREAAEDDPTHKQLIPYSIFRHQGKFLHYTRGKAGGEARLHAKGSIGIGGHINPIDKKDDPLGMATYMAAVGREITEELEVTGAVQQHIVALLNDDSNDVGKVHLGVVHLFEVANDQVFAREDAIANLGFRSIEELRGDLYEGLESWSRILVDSLDDFTQ